MIKCCTVVLDLRSHFKTFDLIESDQFNIFPCNVYSPYVGGLGIKIKKKINFKISAELHANCYCDIGKQTEGRWREVPVTIVVKGYNFNTVINSTEKKINAVLLFYFRVLY